MHVNDILDRFDLQRVTEKFYARVLWQGGPMTCWLWADSDSPDEYGKFKRGRHRHSTHRVAWVLAFGPLPVDVGGEETCVLHHCDTPACCNPTHLFLGSNQDNVDDMLAKGRQARGEATGRAKLTESEVLNILGSNETASVMAEKFGVGSTTIHAIRTRKTWRHLAFGPDKQPKPLVYHGEQVRTAKLTAEQVLAIRADPRTHKTIGLDYGVSRRHVGHLKAGHNWTHLAPNANRV